MNRVGYLGRWFFGLFCTASGIETVIYLAQRIGRDHEWMAHISSIVIAVCCFVAACGLFTWKSWFHLVSIVVAVNAAVGGFLGVVQGAYTRLSILNALIGVAFLVWLRFHTVRPENRVAHT
jgi:hypothetical protein